MKVRTFLLALVAMVISVTSAYTAPYELIDLGVQGINARDANAINNDGQVAYNAIGGAYIWDDINGSQALGYIGGDFSGARDISNNGQVVGASSIMDSPPGGCPGGCPIHAFLYSDGSMQDLGSLGGSYSYAYGVNDKGQVVGSSHTNDDTHIHAFLYHNGLMQDLEDFDGGTNNSWAYAINDNGQIVGSAGGLSGGRL